MYSMITCNIWAACTAVFALNITAVLNTSGHWCAEVSQRCGLKLWQIQHAVEKNGGGGGSFQIFYWSKSINITLWQHSACLSIMSTVWLKNKKNKALNAGETTAFNICIWIQLPIFIYFFYLQDLLDFFHLNSPLQDFFSFKIIGNVNKSEDSNYLCLHENQLKNELLLNNSLTE